MANKKFYLDTGTLILNYPQKISVVEQQTSFSKFGREITLGVDDISPNPASPQGSIANIVQLSLTNVSQKMTIDNEQGTFDFRGYGNFAVKGAAGVDLLRMSHSLASYTYNMNTDEVLKWKEIDSLFIKPSVPIDFGDSGLTSTHDIKYLTIECSKDVDITKVVVYAGGWAKMYLAPDLCSSFSLTSRVSPVNSTDFNLYQVGVHTWNAESANGFSNGMQQSMRSFQISGAGNVQTEVSGRITTVV